MSPRQMPLDLPHRISFAAEDFVVTDSNREAMRWIEAWPAWPGPALTIFGPPGSGKTHLAHIFAARSRAVLLSPLDLARDSPPVLLGSARAAAVDDIGPDLPEAALLHLYNLLAEAGGHLLLAAATPPGRWGLRLADLRSRLAAAPAVAVTAPDDALLGAVLVKLFADRQLAVGEGVLAYLLARMERSLAAAGALVQALDQASLAGGGKVSLALARAVLDGRP